MTNKRREERRQQQRAADPRPKWAFALRQVVLGGSIALVIITTLIPSEGAVAEGSHALIAAGWCLLLVAWTSAVLLGERPRFWLGWTELALVAFVGWHSIATITALGYVNGRQLLNAQWLVVSYGLTFFLLRQSIASAAQVRAALCVMIWLATLLAVLGIYQYGYSMPQLRRQYEASPEQFLAANGFSTEEDAPQRELFENRLRSVEPLATFALTNSLAGLLAPCLVAACGIILTIYRQRDQRRTLFAFLACIALIAPCLVLTKSRTALLAVIAGFILLGLFGRRGAALPWKIPAALAGSAVIIALAAVFFGGLDVEVLSEAPKSVLYRLEYWQATARIIGDHPVLGCGPGNFQQAYANYKLPQASETVSDPHNLLLEIWATAGTPALLLFLALCVGFAVDLSSLTRGNAIQDKATDPSPTDQSFYAIGFGTIAGLIGAIPVALLTGYSFDLLFNIPVVLFLGIPLFAAFVWLAHAWIERGEIALPAIVIAQVVLFLNLSAAGAFTFPGVMQLAFVLAPLALALLQNRQGAAASASSTHATSIRAVSFSAAGKALALLAAVAMMLTCLYSEYYPVLSSRGALAEATASLQEGRTKDAEASVITAAKADPLSPEPWRLLTELRLLRWIGTAAERDHQAFILAADTFLRLDPRHDLSWYTRGNWFLRAWRKGQRPDDLTEAIRSYTEATMYYPNKALYHAQLAWALHLAGQAEESKKQAELAYQLDQKMPHKEQKLARQQIIDPPSDPTKTEAKEGKETAEQIVQRLRTTSSEEMP